jgi:hypothetical protein
MHYPLLAFPPGFAVYHTQIYLAANCAVWTSRTILTKPMLYAEIN